MTVRPLLEKDLDAARRIIRLAFGTFTGAPDPENARADIDYAGTRWRADSSAAFGAELNGELVGSNFATRWGSVGFFGPLTVRPDLWDKGIGQKLMAPVMECFSRWNITHAGLYTFAQSPKHLALYQKFGFSARFLTAILSKPVAPAPAATTEMRWSKYSDATDSECAAILSACREITGAAYAGLDLEREIRAVRTQELGDTVLVWDDSSLAGFAVCHCGPGTEAGNGKCYVKFGMVRPGVDGARVFGGLLARCEALAASRGLSRIDAGVNLNCHEAYRQMLDRGYRAELQGVAMHKPNEPGYHRPEIFVIDDWR